MAIYRGEYAKQVDANTGAFHVIDHKIKELHDGHTFTSGYRQDSLADQASLLIGIQTGSKEAHIEGTVTVGGNAFMDIAAFVTFSNDGTPVYVARKNGNSTIAPTTAVYLNPVVNDAGITILTDFIPGGTKSKASGGGGEADNWGLMPNSNYLITITNKSGAAIALSIILDWIEHTNETDVYKAIQFG